MAPSSLSEKPLLTPETSFTIRDAAKSDAAAIARINEHVVKYSLRGTRDSASPASAIEKGLPDVQVPTMVYLVATLNNNNVDLGEQGHRMGDALGYAILLPYKQDGGYSSSCFNRTASLFLFSFEQDILGEKLYHDITAELVEKALASCKERNLRYRTIAAEFSFHRDQETLTTFRDILMEKGFKEAGLLKQAVEKHGLLLDHITLQRDI